VFVASLEKNLGLTLRRQEPGPMLSYPAAEPENVVA
jgi:hypothetical protein